MENSYNSQKQGYFSTRMSVHNNQQTPAASTIVAADLSAFRASSDHRHSPSPSPLQPPPSRQVAMMCNEGPSPIDARSAATTTCTSEQPTMADLLDRLDASIALSLPPTDASRIAFLNLLLKAPIVFSRGTFASEAAERHVGRIVAQLQLAANYYTSATRESEVTIALLKAEVADVTAERNALFEEVLVRREERAGLIKEANDARDALETAMQMQRQQQAREQALKRDRCASSAQVMAPAVVIDSPSRGFPPPASPEHTMYTAAARLAAYGLADAASLRSPFAHSPASTHHHYQCVYCDCRYAHIGALQSHTIKRHSAGRKAPMPMPTPTPPPPSSSLFSTTGGMSSSELSVALASSPRRPQSAFISAQTVAAMPLLSTSTTTAASLAPADNRLTAASLKLFAAEVQDMRKLVCGLVSNPDVLPKGDAAKKGDAAMDCGEGLTLRAQVESRQPVAAAAEEEAADAVLKQQQRQKCDDGDKSKRIRTKADALDTAPPSPADAAPHGWLLTPAAADSASPSPSQIVSALSSPTASGGVKGSKRVEFFIETPMSTAPPSSSSLMTRRAGKHSSDSRRERPKGNGPVVGEKETTTSSNNPPPSLHDTTATPEAIRWKKDVSCTFH